MTTMKLVSCLKDAAQDFEFYPTTDAIIECLIADASGERGEGRYERYDRRCLSSVLDIGAGSGKVLRAFAERANFTDLYAIEKSSILCQQLPEDVFIIGTEFHEQSLLAKDVDVIFCNPPYSEFKEWAVKIIRESAAKLVYLVIPVRWAESVEIADAIKYRDATSKVLGEFSFIDAEDRAARAMVHLTRIDMADEKDDAFDRFFNEQFAHLKAQFAPKPKDPAQEGIDDDPECNSRFAQLAVGVDYPDRLVALYNDELDHVRKNYDLVSQLDADLLKEFDVTPTRILKCLKDRLSGLRKTYWAELFRNMKQVTDRLTSKKRSHMMETLNRHGHVDFTAGNIHAVVLWVLKNSTKYLDAQLIETFEQMVSKANVRNYVSNTRAFVNDDWRYNQDQPSHIALEFRLVLEQIGGVKRHFRNVELDARAGAFLGDMLTVARNLGFDCRTNDLRISSYSQRSEWKSGATETFDCFVNGTREVLMEVRAFLNGNMHIRINQGFALALNVEYGRLKGWIKSGPQAAEELGVKDAACYFGTHFQLGINSLPMLSGPTTHFGGELVGCDCSETQPEMVFDLAS